MKQGENEQVRTKMGMLGKVATTIIGTRIAAESGKAGLVGAAVGMVATRVLARSPAGAIAIGGAYVAHKLWQKKQQIDKKGPHQAAVEDGLAKPSDVPVGKRAGRIGNGRIIDSTLVKATPLKKGPLRKARTIAAKQPPATP